MTDKKYAVLNTDSTVVNLVLWDGDTENWEPPTGCTAVVVPADSQVSIGYLFADGAFVAPPAPPAPPPAVPASVTMRQTRLALLAAGKLGAVDTAIAALPSPQKEEAQIEWTFATSVERSSPVVALLGPALGFDDAALDDLFTVAATL